MNPQNHSPAHDRAIILYGSPSCPMVPPVRSMLRRANASFEYVNISLDRVARKRVMEINQGNASVPTLVFPDGSTLTEPSGDVLRAKLQSLGYEVAPSTALQQALVLLSGPLPLVLGIVFLAVGLSDRATVLPILGTILVVASLLARWLG